MMTDRGLAILAAAVLALGFALMRLLALLLYFQQEEYDRRRFLRWLKAAGARDRWTSLTAGLGVVIGFSAVPAYQYLALGVTALGLVEGMRRSLRVLKRAKKRLRLTARARRILAVATLIAAAVTVLVGALPWAAGAPGHPAVAAGALALILAQGAPYMLGAADALLGPLERSIQARYRREAEAKLARLDPMIIGVTGSFGKTSTKHILGHLLEALGPTLVTPGSVNTEMGIVRVVREQLEPRHRTLVVEMGAYGPGSIARLARLTPPRLGILTAVGEAHYERFERLETVARAKMELAEAVWRVGGPLVAVLDGVDDIALRTRLRHRDLPGRVILVGSDPEADWRVLGIDEDAAGVSVDFCGPDGQRRQWRAPLYGRHQGWNLMAAAAAAHELGLPLPAIAGALGSLRPVAHRLAVTRSSGGLTVIDDAYNSNPRGFEAALRLLARLGEEQGGRRVLLTPGMVELGARHEAAHRALGKAAAGAADIVLIVRGERFPSFEDGLRAAAADRPPEIHRFARQEEAEDWLKRHARAGDVVLIENNLPDLYEAPPRF